MSVDEVIFNDWHPVAALDDVASDKRYRCRLLGRTVSYVKSAEGVTALWEQGPEDIKHIHAKEIYGVLWLSFAEKPTEMFDIPEFNEPDRRVVSAGSVRVNVSGLRAIENFLDMAHFPFVHTDILGAEPLTEVEPYKVHHDEEKDEIFATECRFPQPKGSATAVEPIDMQYIYRITRPYSAILYKTCPPQPERWDALGLFIQPVDEDWCIAHTIMCYVDEVNSDQQLRHFQQTIFGQDLMILINQVPKRLPLAASRESPVRADVLATAYRRWMREKGVQYGTLRD
ncbi:MULTISPECIES: aromatic ring-hydroxylating oxygenase subunit alpha [Pseudomonas]|uniref:aromatic ring-hydroxylating oxygenase subunit alpha n=1 Tax=Pseudomonas TaxID=286 RepID=UPI00137A52B7|nr:MULTISPECIES: aromatic ring-hydroxylating dioxygenase subunit alpha [Pseudomonas]QPN46285.1 aromatic ring-hydroxylating dioxygenase subunit alpha [Priestia aryabhattai]ELU0814377.1 aromatic ring-hydroxylating dioxygenase subunit alpha [Pseudomonas putida]KAF1311432.1 (2Fe-2S)-binding protein [Pseudomonas sp. SG-MS2]KAF4561164.1 methylxanthine N7-demethylase [Pseudomonas sp. CES]MCE0881489.1 aromatic ring-hydroxylating dioxygenase subunit alpha [Pseudomonas putida]